MMDFKKVRMCVLSNKENVEKKGAIDLPGTAKVTVLSWEPFFQYWRSGKNHLDWSCIFMLPPWLKSWADSYGSGLDLHICAVLHQHRLIGIAPLIINEKTASFMGSSDLTDHVDFILSPGQETLFFRTLFSHMRQEGVDSLDLGQVRADSSVIPALKMLAKKNDCEVRCGPVERIYELVLPGTWREYLYLLTGKERHEIRRKLRRLHEAGHITYSVTRQISEVEDAMDVFLRLFRSNTSEKALFMSPDRETFFRNLTHALAESGFLKLSFLQIDGIPAAATFCFDYYSTVYLYNNGYDDRYRSLSVGLLSKVFSIRESIQQKRKKYNFLKGDETYKGRLGASPVQLYGCRIKLK